MLDILLLPFSLWVAAVAAFLDWRTGKIPNRLLLIGLLLGAQALVAQGVWLGLGGPGRSTVLVEYGPLRYHVELLLNGGIAFLLGLGLWWFNVWAAGDAKLFAVLALLFPLGFYENNLLSVFPAFVLLVNTFLCLIVVLLAELLWKLARRALQPGSATALVQTLRGAAQRAGAGAAGLARLALGFAAIFMVIRVLRHFVANAVGGALPLNRTQIYVILFVLFTPLSRLFGDRRVFWGSVAAIVFYVVYAFGLSDDAELRGAVIHIGWMSLSIVTLGWLYTAYTDFTEVRRVPVREVRVGMLLSEPYARSLRENSEFNNERMGSQGPDGLTALQVETLRTWHARNHPAGEDAVAEVAKTIPFAPAMLAAVVLTALMRGYLVLY